jgi:hypothetical protein
MGLENLEHANIIADANIIAGKLQVRLFKGYTLQI